MKGAGDDWSAVRLSVMGRRGGGDEGRRLDDPGVGKGNEDAAVGRSG